MFRRSVASSSPGATTVGFLSLPPDRHAPTVSIPMELREWSPNDPEPAVRIEVNGTGALGAYRERLAGLEFALWNVGPARTGKTIEVSLDEYLSLQSALSVLLVVARENPERIVLRPGRDQAAGSPPSSIRVDGEPVREGWDWLSHTVPERIPVRVSGAPRARR